MSNVTKKESIATCLTLFLAAAVQIIIIKSFGPENKTIQRIQTRFKCLFFRSRFGIEINSFMLLSYSTEWGPPSTTAKWNYCSACDYDEGKLT